MWSHIHNHLCVCVCVSKKTQPIVLIPCTININSIQFLVPNLASLYTLPLHYITYNIHKLYTHCGSPRLSLGVSLCRSRGKQVKAATDTGLVLTVALMHVPFSLMNF